MIKTHADSMDLRLPRIGKAKADYAGGRAALAAGEPAQPALITDNPDVLHAALDTARGELG